MKCLIVDDDPLCCNLLEEYASRVNFLDYIVKANDGADAFNLLQSGGFDLVFLDIEMPKMDGVSLLKSMNFTIPVIITTSYQDFAIASYDYNVTDYLIKPIEFARFVKAVNKAHEQHKQLNTLKEVENKNNEVFIKDGHNLVKIDLSSVLYIEAGSNYLTFVSSNKSNLALITMKKLEEKLPGNFLRVHRSYIVNLDKIEKVQGNELLLDGKIVPFSNSYKEVLFKKLNLIV